MINKSIIEIRTTEQVRVLKVVSIILLFFLMYFLIFFYPKVTDGFDYWHMTTAIYTEMSNSIVNINENSGYYILTVIIHEIANISYDLIPRLPIQSISFILLLIMLLRNISDDKSVHMLLIIGILIIFITKFGYQNYFGWWCHGIGFILALLTISIATLRFNSKLKNQPAISIILIITLISVNFISYKLTFFIIVFLLSLQIIVWISNFQSNEKITKKSHFEIIILIGIVNVLSFNKMFYNTFIPRLRMTSEVTTSGIEKLFLPLGKKSFSPLDEYYLQSLPHIRYANTIWLVLILICLIFLTITISEKLRKNEKLSSGEIIVCALVFASLIILTIYTYIGVFDLNYLVFSSIIGFVILYEKHHLNYKLLVSSSIALLLILNFYSSVELNRGNYNMGMDEWNYDQYMAPSTKWYIEKIVPEYSNHNIMIASDVYTGGYVSKEIAKNNLSHKYAPQIFSNIQMQSILIQNKSVYKQEGSFTIINYRLHHFSAINWEVFNSWSNNRQHIKNNQYVRNIYSSGDIEIYMDQ